MKTRIGLEGKAKWTHLVSQYTDDVGWMENSWKEIEAQYGKKTRQYHNLTHIYDLLNQAEAYQAHITDFDVLCFAIWYHDIIYRATKGNNEERSAQLAASRLKELGWAQGKVSKCERLILATKSHQMDQNSEDTDVKWLLDFDLSILGRDWEVYESYTKQIRKEYSIYPDFLYIPGRKKVLHHFLTAKQIFKTDPYVQAYEAQARSNLEREIRQL